ncbi:ABC transporter permease [Amycolatopsis sp. lyj-112]|uniref:ABC transporter permease n=1 Tax=Amycolatopsis sp. lyj-112 TaxID=2789288 RepID=UPI00397C2046
MRGERLDRLTVLIRHNFRLRLRDPGHLVSYLVMPMVLMLAFKPLYSSLGASGATQTVMGMTVMFSALSLSVVGTATLTERQWQTWERLCVTPASVGELLVGKAVPVFVLLVCQQVVLMTYGVLVVGMQVTGGELAFLAFSVIVWSCALLAIGTALAVLARSHGEMSAITDVGALTLSVLGGAFAPVASMPSWVRDIAPISPGYWAMTMYRAATDGQPRVVLSSALVLAAITVAAAALAVFRANRGLSPLKG